MHSKNDTTAKRVRVFSNQLSLDEQKRSLARSTMGCCESTCDPVTSVCFQGAMSFKQIWEPIVVLLGATIVDDALIANDPLRQFPFLGQ